MTRRQRRDLMAPGLIAFTAWALIAIVDLYVYYKTGLAGMRGLLEQERHALITHGVIHDPVATWQWICALVLMVTGGLIGLMRAGRIDPIRNQPYREWLTLTPWDGRTRPPLGSQLPHWGDAVALLLLLGASLYGRVPPHWPVGVLLAIYSLNGLQAHGPSTSHLRFATFVLLMLAVECLRFSIPASVVCVAIAATAVSASLRFNHRAIATGSFRDQAMDACLLRDPAVREKASRLHPLLTLAPVEREPWTWPSLLKLAVCVGLVTHLACLGYELYVDPAGAAVGLWTLCIGAVVVLCLCRWLRYASFGRPPLHLWGRVRQGRPIIPRYDVMHLGWLLPLIVTPVVAGVLAWSALPEAVACALTLSVFIVVLGKAPPSLRWWRFCGAYRDTAIGRSSAVSGIVLEET